MTKNWFITGVSAGLGREMALQLLARGDTVAGTSRRAGANDDLVAAHGSRFVALTLDMADGAAIDRVTNAAFDRLGQVDVVVGNAAYGLVGAAEEVTDDEITQQIAANLTGSIRLIRACLPHLRARHGGRIMQVSSEGGQMAYPLFSIYHATKWGIEGFIEAVAQEVGPFGIDFVIAEPGPTRTSFRQSAVLVPAMAEYDATPAGMVRQMIESGRFEMTGDATKTAASMIAACDSPAPPRRLVLGSGAQERVAQALRARLGEVEAQRDSAGAVDRAR